MVSIVPMIVNGDTKGLKKLPESGTYKFDMSLGDETVELYGNADVVEELEKIINTLQHIEPNDDGIHQRKSASDGLVKYVLDSIPPRKTSITILSGDKHINFSNEFGKFVDVLLESCYVTKIEWLRIPKTIPHTIGVNKKDGTYSIEIAYSDQRDFAAKVEIQTTAKSYQQAAFVEYHIKELLK